MQVQSHTSNSLELCECLHNPNGCSCHECSILYSLAALRGFPLLNQCHTSLGRTSQTVFWSEIVLSIFFNVTREGESLVQTFKKIQLPCLLKKKWKDRWWRNVSLYRSMPVKKWEGMISFRTVEELMVYFLNMIKYI